MNVDGNLANSQTCWLGPPLPVRACCSLWRKVPALWHCLGALGTNKPVFFLEQKQPLRQRGFSLAARSNIVHTSTDAHARTRVLAKPTLANQPSAISTYPVLTLDKQQSNPLSAMADPRNKTCISYTQTYDFHRDPSEHSFHHRVSVQNTPTEPEIVPFRTRCLLASLSTPAIVPRCPPAAA